MNASVVLSALVMAFVYVSTTDAAGAMKRQAACQDGSGGMCVDVDTCPPEKRANETVPGACTFGQECCFGTPTTATSCSSRGGECVLFDTCHATEITADCPAFGHICCVLVA